MTSELHMFSRFWKRIGFSRKLCHANTFTDGVDWFPLQDAWLNFSIKPLSRIFTILKISITGKKIIRNTQIVKEHFLAFWNKATENMWKTPSGVFLRNFKLIYWEMAELCYFVCKKDAVQAISLDYLPAVFSLLWILFLFGPFKKCSRVIFHFLDETLS